MGQAEFKRILPAAAICFRYTELIRRNKKRIKGENNKAVARKLKILSAFLEQIYEKV